MGQCFYIKCDFSLLLKALHQYLKSFIKLGDLHTSGPLIQILNALVNVRHVA